ncbi:hydrogenase nickel insertion protein HypA [Thermoanaerobacter mathranii subsp. mathranii str. A3]|uniref:Hydrogenase maturation factor HypA n=2 Tax=Thermoanaerobacter TaxID=1754 RepID=A0ABT9M6X5_9THEO|nr:MULTISPECIES: hydrogenase maturation nickel metallochaperone HypA [Thermoanaerobacter]ADH61309.1 hydrogenase nickel insertion protein HypA [Thermoanaerobacter mathranii subsp. mathranii str. A3]MDP9751862.1 hydrogenase nickel incorporation protein HypA/HybF [Thermoanaerobacter pentosaceus]
MHELSVTQSLVDMVLEEAQKREIKKVTKVTIVIGELTGLESESIQFYFGVLSENTVAEGAELVFKKIKAQFKCGQCGNIFERVNFTFNCPVCGSTGVLVDKGKEFYIESIEVE